MPIPRRKRITAQKITSSKAGKHDVIVTLEEEKDMMKRQHEMLQKTKKIYSLFKNKK